MMIKKLLKMYECGYIDHTGILLTLSGKEWIDPPQIFEILFDSFKKENCMLYTCDAYCETNCSAC